MKIYKRLKKGFTLVELVVVIAVIAILAAVSVISYISITKKANQSKDQQIVTEANSALQRSEILKGKPSTVYEALGEANEGGFKMQNIETATKGYEYAYVKSANRFVVLEDDKIVYPTEGFEDVKNLDIWRFSEADDELDDGFAHYLKGKAEINDILVSSGFDVGENTVKKVQYVRSPANSQDKKEALIRTNGGALTVNAPNDTVFHFGSSDVVTLSAVGSNSYYEHGSANLIDIKKGRLVITNDEVAEVGTIYLTATNDAYDGIILATQSGSELPDVVARESVTNPTSGEKLVVTIQTSVDEKGENPQKTEEIFLYPASDVKEGTNGYDVSDLGLLVVEAISSEAQTEAASQISSTEILEAVMETKVEDSETIHIGATLFDSGAGSQKNPFMISTPEHLMKIGSGLDEGAEVYYQLKNDVILEDDMRTFDDDYAYYNIVDDIKQNIHFDLNQKAISNINGVIFDRLYHVEVFNGKLNFNANTKDATLVEVIKHADEGATASFHDISIEGTALISEDHWGPLVSYMYGCNTHISTISADKILVNLTVKNSCNDSYSGGLFGYIQGNKICASITNCQVNGSIQSPYAYGFFNGCSYPNGAVVVNSGNALYGSLLGSKGVGVFGLNGNYKVQGDTPASQNALVTNNGQTAIVSETDTLIVNYDGMSFGDQIVISNSDSNVSYITVSLVYWTNRVSDGTGGYPNNIDVRIDVDGENGTFNSGLYKNKFVQSSTRYSGSKIVNESYRQVWKTGDTYMVYQDDAIITNFKVQLHVYAYNASGTMITYQSEQYVAK